jgi:TonB family protein
MKLLKLYSLAVTLMLIASADALAQSQTDADRAAQQAIKALHSHDIPEASLPCTPEETKWWDELRATAKGFNRAQPDRPDTKKLMHLIKEGIDKSYQLPVPDRYATVLWQSHPHPTPQPNYKRVDGSIALAVELLPDGNVGEVKVAQGLDPDLDQMAIETARKLIFLPAVKDRKFVSLWMPITMSFNSCETYHR